MSQQFTESDRAVLAQLLALQVPKKEIAARLKKARSSIYRELERNSGPLGYIAMEAQQRAEVRRWLSRRDRQAERSAGREVCRPALGAVLVARSDCRPLAAAVRP